MLARLKLGSGNAGGSSGGGVSGFKLRGREVALIAISVAALSALLWYFYLYTPTQGQIEQLRSENGALEQDIALGRAARANLPELRAEVAQLKEQRDVFLAQLPEENEVAELLDQLRSAARAARVGFTGLQNGGPGSDVVPGVRLLNFTLATEGNYTRTIQFLRTLEALPRFTRVQRVGLNAATDGGADPNLSASYDFTVYVYTGSGPEAAPLLDGSAVPGTEETATETEVQ